MPKATAIYCRISDDRTGQQAGVKRQEEDCRTLAEARGWPVAEVYTDNDLSAWNGKARPEYQRLMENIRSGAVDALVVWHLDRLHRHPRELEEFFDVADQAGLRHMATVSGDVDLSTDDGKFYARLLGAVARKESDDKSRRIRRKMEELAKAGRGKGGGTRPFGFEDDRLTIRRAEARLIRDAAKRVLLGASIRSVASEWNERGIKTPTGKEWRTASVRRMLMSPRIAGLRQHRGEVVGEAVWPGIIDRPTHEQLRALLGDSRRQRNGGAPARRYLLTGFAYCGLCGARLIARPRPGQRAMVCASGPNFGGCGRIRIMAAPLEGFIAEAIFTALDSEGFADALRKAGEDDEDHAALVESLTADEAALDQLARDHYADRIIGRSEFIAAREQLESRIEATRRHLARRTGTALADLPSGPDALRKAWEKGDLVWRRSVVGAILERVEIGPAVRGRNFFDPDRARLVWRV